MLALKYSTALLALAVSGLTLWPAGPRSPAADSVPHFDLARSVPAADSTVHAAPTELRLWFTDEPQDGTTAVRVLNAAEEPISTGEATLDPEDATSVRIPFTTPVPAGQYTVTWRAIGPDGHVVTGDFGFGVMIMEEAR